MDKQQGTYESAGVSIDAQDRAIAAFKAAVEATHGPEVVAGVGAFGAAFAPDLTGIAEPVFVSSTDSLGTKTILHARFGTHGWAGRDVVGCVVNDVICSGAKPVFFLDYIAMHKLIPDEQRQIVTGVAEACGEIGCALIGGELAEMRDVYKPTEFDLVGFAVGLADRNKMLTGASVCPGDVIISLASTGVHCNGFSLARQALAGIPDAQWTINDESLGMSLKDALLRPTRCYANEMAGLSAAFNIKSAAHISGGGLIDNVPRVIPDGTVAVVDRNKVPVLPVFDIIQRQGHIADDEMWHVFNMGAGFVVIVGSDQADGVMAHCNEHNLGASVIGEIAAARDGQQFVWAG